MRIQYQVVKSGRGLPDQIEDIKDTEAEAEKVCAEFSKDYMRTVYLWIRKVWTNA